MNFYVYILASKPNGVLYTGMTNTLSRRIDEHKRGVGSKHTAKYKTFRLVWVEKHDDQEEARYREKQIKGWRRDWKNALIEKHNPCWEDISRLPLA